jgi:hypothetical protein
MRQVPIARPLADGALLSGLLGVLVVASLAYNARIWQQDYPPAIQVRAGPMSPADKRQRLIVAIPFLTILLRVPVYANLRLRRRKGGQLAFASAFANAYAVTGLANLLVVRLRPDFVVLPGTAGMDAYADAGFHVVNYFKGVGIGLVQSAVTAWLTHRTPRETRA